MIVNIKKLHPNAVIPKKAHTDDAGFDLTAVNAYLNDGKWICHSGLAFEIPVGYVGLIFPRSSVKNTNLTLSNCVGVIDSGYIGEVTAVFKIDATTPEKFYEEGHRFAQMVIMPFTDVQFNEVETLKETERGQGGYGSSGR
jgi:dUTP pyrophosphatase